MNKAKNDNKLPKGWEWKSFNEVVTLIQNGLLGNQTDEKKGFPISRIETLQNETFDENRVKYVELENPDFQKYKYDHGDIAFSHINSFEKLGKVALYDGQIENLVHGVNLLRIKFFNSVFPKYAFYFLNSKIARKQYEQHIKKAINQASINQKNFRTIQIPLPPLPEQQRIVQQLDALFERIDKAILLTRENLEHCTHLLPAALNEVFGKSDAKEVCLTEVCDFNPPKSEIKGLSDIEVSFVPMADMNEKQMHFEAKQSKQLTEVYTGYTYFKENDVLLAKVTPCFENGKSGIAKNLKNKIGFGSSEYYVFRPNEKILPEWIYYNITSSEFLHEGAKNMSGAVGLKRVTKDFINNWKIKLPDIQTQQRIVTYLNQLSSKQQQLQQHYSKQLQQLQQLKASLLDAAFRGEL